MRAKGDKDKTEKVIDRADEVKAEAKEEAPVERTISRGDAVAPAKTGAAKNVFVTTIRRPAAAAIRLINGKAIITANRKTEIVNLDTSRELIIALSVGNPIPNLVSREQAREQEAKEEKKDEAVPSKS